MSDQNNEKLLNQLKEAIVAIRKLKSELQKEKASKTEPIAVVGMGMRFPGGVTNAKEYWKLLENGVDAITDIPKERYDVDALYDADPNTPGKITVKQGGFIDNVDLFDVSFFDISPVELENVDPQQRVLLEATHEAFENAGINVLDLKDSNTGVFMGVANNDYQSKHFRSGDYKLINPYSFTGSTISANAGRISYLMGLQGPSVTMDTACSSSLVATHLAVQSLRDKECDIAIAGGVNIVLEPEITIYFSTLNALSPEGRCKSFDNDANGFVRSEGCGVIILKRLSDAQRDGDNILAVIKGSAVNQDGRSNGFTAPNVAAQEKLIRKALENAQLSPEAIGFIEAHGTGTKIGDPIEMEALAKVFKASKTKENPLLIGSVKSNIGHLEAAAGMAGIIKAILCVQHGKAPKNLHFNTPNELIHWQSLPVKVPTQMEAMSGAVGVSGFGVTGTNGHVIIAAAHEQERTEQTANPSDIFTLAISAKSLEALYANALVYADFIQNSSDALEDICAAAALQRAHFEYRQAFTSRDKADLIQQLKDFAQSKSGVTPTFEKEDEVKVVFIFPGQGAQWVGMGKAIMQREPVFKEAMEACNTAFKNYVDWDLIEVLNQSLETIDIIQPVVVAIEIALAKWWQHMGIQPDVVVGHSMGEVAAAYIAGHLSLDDAANVICNRSKLMKQRSGLGVMGVTELSFEEAQERIKGLEDKLSVAVTNSPTSTVISGEESALNTVFEALEKEGKFCRLIKVDVASHSPQMDPILEDLRSATQNIQPKDGEVDFYSTALNKELSGSELTADYWVKNLRNPVRFGDVIRTLAEDDKTIFIELGPHPVLFNAIQENISHIQKDGSAKVVASFYREKDECKDLITNLSELYTSGIDLNWTKLYHKPSKHIELPNYQWQRERFWFDEQPDIQGKKKSSSIQTDVSDNFYHYDWENVRLLEDDNYSEEHILVVQDESELGETLSNLLEGDIEITTLENISAALTDNSFDKIVFVQTGNFDLKESIQKGSLALQKVIKAIQELSTEATPHLITITKNVFAQDSDYISTSGALTWGIARTLRNEYPELNTISIDVNDGDENIKLAASIINQPQEDIKEYTVRSGAIQTQVLKQGIETNPNVGFSFDKEACFLITGGTSGLGLAMGEWLAKNGVKNIALVSRSGEKAETKSSIEIMEAAGAKVKVFKADIGDKANVEQLIADIQSSLAKVTGVIHAAGLLEDGTFVNLNEDQFFKVANPKVNGALNLHETLLQNKLTHFISFSSGASVLGSVAQSNYNGANFYLDQLMLWRANHNLPATSINWGNIGGVGLAAAQENRGARLSEIGMNTIQPEEFEAFFETVLLAKPTQVIPMKIDFNLWAQAHPSVKQDITFSNVLVSTDNAVSINDSSSHWGNSLASATKKLKDTLKTHISAITKIPTARIKEDDTFKSMGIDSMMALQLKNKIQADTNLNIAVSSIWTHATIEKYVAFLITEMKLEEQFSSQSSGSVGSSASSIKNIKDKLKQHIASITKIQIARLKESDTFKSMGIDSMQALQLKNKLQADFGLNLAVSSIWTHPTIEKYTAFLAAELGLSAKEEEDIQPTKVVESKTSEEINKEVDDLSLDDLMKELDGY